MKIVVNQSLCEGNGSCEAVAPQLFRLDDDDNLQLLQEGVSEKDRESAEAAVRACPKSALRLIE